MFRTAISFGENDLRQNNRRVAVHEFPERSRPIDLYCYACGLPVDGPTFWMHTQQDGHRQGNRQHRRSCGWEHSPFNAESPYFSAAEV